MSREVSCLSWLALLALATTGCRLARQSPLDDAARQYVRLAVALGERDPDSLDYYAGPADRAAGIRAAPPPLSAIRRDASRWAASLQGRADLDQAERQRREALLRDLSAMVARVDLLTGSRWPYDQESRAFFGIAPGRIDDAALERLRSRIAALVGGRGLLVDRYAAFAARFVVPAERLPVVMRAALDECRRLTVAHVALPPGERVSLEFVRDRPWSAFSRYLGDGESTIQINTDFSFTVDQALQTACHEGYPGHHTRNTLSAPRRDDGRMPERSVQLMFTPEALASEAAAMLAVDAAFSEEARVAFAATRLLPLAGLDAAGAASHVAVERLVGDLQLAQVAIARRYLDGELDFVRAAAALQEQALVPHADALVKYINEYRSYLTTYTSGRALLAARIAACAGVTPTDDIRWRCFKTETALR